MTAIGALESIVLRWTRPTTKADGTLIAAGSLAGFRVYISDAPGINVANPATYDAVVYTDAEEYVYTVPNPGTYLGPWYFRVVALDTSGNASSPTDEVSASANANVAVPPPVVDDWATGNVESVLVGRGRIFLRFRLPKDSWLRFAHYNVYYDVDTGGGFSGTWTYIGSERIGFMHSPLNIAYKYRYRVSVVAEDGTETAGSIHDNGGPGYQPNQSDQGLILADTIASQYVIAQYDMIARTFIGGKLQSTNWGPSAGSLYDLDTGTIKLGGSDAPKFQVGADGVLTATGATISGALIAGTGSSISYAYVSGGPPADADKTSTVINGGLITTGTIQFQDGAGITKAGMTAAGTGDTNVRIWAGETYANRASAPFRVTQGGAMTATSGAIGGFTITSAALSAGSGSTRIQLQPGTGIWCGADTFSAAPFRVTPGGAMTATSGEIGGFTITSAALYAGSGSTRIQLQPGTGIWCGADSFSLAPFRVSPSGAVTCSNITITGGVVPYTYVTGGPPSNADNTATVITAGLITTGRIELKDTADVTKAGITGGGTGDTAIRIWAGDTYANRASAPFRVTQGGAMTATSGVIGGFTITSAALYAGSGSTRIQLQPGTGIWCGADSFSAAPFRVTPGGAMTATSGVIGGFTITSAALYAGSGSTRIQLQPGTGIWCGADTFSAAPFRVSPSGAVTCSNITITGGSVAGSIVGSGISADNITAGTLTGRTIRTAASGVRAEMGPSGTFPHHFTVYGSTGNYVARLGRYENEDGGALQLAHDGRTKIAILAGSPGVASVIVTYDGGLQIDAPMFGFPGSGNYWQYTGDTYHGSFFLPARGIYVYIGGSRYAIPVYGPV